MPNVQASQVNVFQQQLELASNIRSSNRTQFNQIINELSDKKSKLSLEQQIFLLYLQGYQKIIAGELEVGISLLDQVINQQKFPSLKHRAITTKISVFTSSENYKEGFNTLNKLLLMLNDMERDDKARYQDALFGITMFYNRLTQYRLSQKYIEKLLASHPSAWHQCISSMLQVEASFRLNELTWQNIADNNVEICLQQKEYIASTVIYSFTANWYLQQNRPQLALSLLKKNIITAKKTQYYLAISELYSLMAQAHYDLNDFPNARTNALKVLNSFKASHKSDSIVRASKILYQITKQQKEFKQALQYHEIYQQHYQLINDDANKRNISYQISQKDVQDKIHQISLLDGKNKVLELEKQLFENSSQKKQLFILFLIIIVLAVSYWAYLSKRAQLRLKNMAEHDELTGIFNRHSFNELASSALNYCKTTDQDASLILFDLDNFKNINDTYGHDIGDWVLKHTIKTCQELSRKNDIIGRFGGEEFTILLPGCNEDKAAELAEKYRKAIFEMSTSATGFNFQISASFGICPSMEEKQTLQEVIKAADQAMYHSKRSGRNRVSIYPVSATQ